MGYILVFFGNKFWHKMIEDRYLISYYRFI